MLAVEEAQNQKGEVATKRGSPSPTTAREPEKKCLLFLYGKQLSKMVFYHAKPVPFFAASVTNALKNSFCGSEIIFLVLPLSYGTAIFG